MIQKSKVAPQELIPGRRSRQKYICTAARCTYSEVLDRQGQELIITIYEKHILGTYAAQCFIASTSYTYVYRKAYNSNRSPIARKSTQ